MKNFIIHSADTAPKKSQPLLKQIADDIGFTPNIFAVTAESDQALSGLMEINNAFSHSSFTAEEQQVILMATSVANGCVYCVAGHTLMAKGLGIPEEIIESLRTLGPVNHHRYAALHAVVNELIQYRGRIDESTLSHFMAQGFSKAQFFELVLGISEKTFTNYVSNALSLIVDDAFKPYQWDLPEELQKTA